MADTIVIETPVATVLEVSGKQGPQGIPGATGATGATGPQGPAGTGIETLTTAGDLLYRDNSAATRLPIGSAGQVLKVSNGLPAWANESGAVTSVNGETGAVILDFAESEHAIQHEAGNADEIQAMAALVTTEDASLNGIYVPNASGTSSGGRLTLYKPGTRENTKLEYNSSLNGWYLIKNTVVQLAGQEENATYAWTPQQWLDQRSPQVLPNGGTVTRAGLEVLARRAADGTSNVAPATTTQDGLLSAADKTKLNNAVETSRTISAGTGLTGGGDLTANRTLSVSFGSSAGTACEGNDTRLSDSRNPLAHKTSHATGGSDALAPSDIGAQSIFVTQNITSGQTLTAQRARIYTVLNFGSAYTITLPNEANGSQNGDVAVFLGASLSNPVTIAAQDQGNLVTLSAALDQYRYTFGSGAWNLTRVDSHEASRITSGTLAHERGGLEADVSAYNGLVKISGGSTSAVTVTAAGEALLDDATNADQRTTLGLGTAAVANLGTGATDAAYGNHTHSQLHDRSHAITSTSDHTAGNHKVFYSNGSGEIVELALGSSGTVLTSNGATSAPSFAAASGGIAAIGASAADILSVSGSDLVADDPNADRLVFWDDSAGALKYLTAGSGLTITDTTITASGGVGGSSGSVDNAILRADGTGGSTSQGSAFVIADNATASPNNTVNHASIQATGDTANVSVSIVPKGTGALSLHVPDGTSTGGNTRGTRACDFQRSRSTAAQVASGQDSFIAGGNGSTASGNFSFIGGGDGNVASGSSSAVIGSWLGTASSNRATVISSYFSTASQEQAAVINGNSSSATQTHALAVGHSAVADAACLIAEGFGAIGATGSSQALRYMLRGTTTTNSAVELQGGPNANVRLRCPSGKVMFMNIMIVGVSNGGGTVATFQRQYAIKNINGTTSEIYAPVTIGTDSAASTSITVDANDTNDSVRVQCTGLSATTIRWVAHISAVEVAHG